MPRTTKRRTRITTTLTITNFISVLEDAGVELEINGDKLSLVGRVSALPPEQIHWLKTHKADAMAMVRIHQNPVRRYVSLSDDCEAFSSHELAPAYWRLASEVD